MFTLCGRFLEDMENLFHDFWSPFSISLYFSSEQNYLKKMRGTDFGPYSARTPLAGAFISRRPGARESPAAPAETLTLAQPRRRHRHRRQPRRRPARRAAAGPRRRRRTPADPAARTLAEVRRRLDFCAGFFRKPIGFPSVYFRFFFYFPFFIRSVLFSV